MTDDGQSHQMTGLSLVTRACVLPLLQVGEVVDLPVPGQEHDGVELLEELGNVAKGLAVGGYGGQDVLADAVAQLAEAGEFGVLAPAEQELALEEVVEEGDAGAGVPEQSVTVPLGQGQLFVLFARHDLQHAEYGENVVRVVFLEKQKEIG